MFHHFPIFTSLFEILCMTGIGTSGLYVAFLAGRKQAERQLDAEAIQDANLDRWFEELRNSEVEMRFGKN